jgi:hypothetical protein
MSDTDPYEREAAKAAIKVLQRELAEADQKWERRLIAALGGHADSKLWGDDGLIAATWRCVEGYEKMEKELAEAKAEAEKWEKLHDQDTEHLVSLQKRDNYGPTETLNQTAVRLSRELDEMTARAISLSMHLPPQTLAGDVQNWRDEVLEEMNSLKRELARWRELPAKVEGLIPQTNIPLSAAQVRTNALYQVLDFIAAVKGGDK